MTYTDPEVQTAVDELVRELKDAINGILVECNREFRAYEPTDAQIYAYNEFSMNFSMKVKNLKLVLDPLKGVKHERADTGTTFIAHGPAPKKG